MPRRIDKMLMLSHELRTDLLMSVNEKPDKGTLHALGLLTDAMKILREAKRELELHEPSNSSTPSSS